jgi:hypothetical protein
VSDRPRIDLPWPLPPLRRAIRDHLGPRTILTDELPPERRPSALAFHRSVEGLGPVESELTVLSYNVQRGHKLERAITTVREAVYRDRPDLVLLREAPLELLGHPRLESLMASRTLFYAPFHQVDRPDRFYSSRQYGQLIATAGGPSTPASPAAITAFCRPTACGCPGPTTARSWSGCGSNVETLEHWNVRIYP